MKRERYSDSVRIVQIDTHFVETDAVNFREVVQSFTGKDKPAVWAGNGFLLSSSSSSSHAAAAAETNGGVEAEAEAGKNYNYNDNEVDRFHGGVEAEAGKNYNDNDNEVDRFQGGAVAAAVKPGDEREIKYEEDDYILSFMKVNNLSFKDFDRLWSEFPPMEDL